jgi:hypothetical protein
MSRNAKRVGLALVLGVLAVAGTRVADAVASYDFQGPVFGLATAPDGSLLVADAGAGIVELRKGVGSLVAALPGVTDVSPIGRGDMFAIRGGGPGLTTGALFRVSRGSTRMIADLYTFEAAVNPHPTAVDSNPFDVEALTGGQALVADAGGNTLLIVDQRGTVDWVAVFPDALVSTTNIKALAGCPSPSPFCGLPPMIPAQAVSTSVAIGPDGDYYVGELKGFPAPTGASQVWRVKAGTRHAVCPSAACTVVATGFTSIVDLAFGPDGTLYVVEFDVGSWAAVEIFGTPLGGTVNACNITTWACTPIASGLPTPIAVAVDRSGSVFAAVDSLGSPQVIQVQ